MDIQTLTAELTEAWDQIRAKGRAEGKAEGRAEGKAENRAELTAIKREELLDAAAPYLSPGALHRCTVALSHQSWDDLPRVADVVTAVARNDAPQALERLLSGSDPEPCEGRGGPF